MTVAMTTWQGAKPNLLVRRELVFILQYGDGGTDLYNVVRHCSQHGI